MKMRVCLVSCQLVCGLALMLMSARPAHGQSSGSAKPTVYTYVSEWAVPRAMWADYKKEDDTDIEAMKKAMAEGLIVSYGSFAVLNHREGAPTHGSWFTANSMAN